MSKNCYSRYSNLLLLSYKTMSPFFLIDSGSSYLGKGMFWNIKPLIHSQINLIKFVESDKFDNACNKIWHTCVRSNWSNFKKIECVLLHKINLIKNSQSKFKSPHGKKKLQMNKLTIWNFTAWTSNLKK